MSNRLQRAEQFRRLLQLFAASLEQEKALEISTVFPAYQAGRSYAAGDYLTCGVNSVVDPQLYRVGMAHTTAAGVPPNPHPFRAPGAGQPGLPAVATAQRRPRRLSERRRGQR